MAMKKNWKENGTPITKTDIAINKMVIDGVKKYFPTHDVLGEEQSHRPNHGKYLWVCDPVDGTIPFSHGVPTCVFSLALVKDGKPILGVIYDPFMNRLVFAEKGKGAFLNGKRTHVNKRGMELSSLSWESTKSFSQIRKHFKSSFPFAVWSVIYGAMLVATGEFVAAFYPKYFAHDAASIKIIVEEAGGKVTDMHGKEQRYDGKINGCLATNGVVHKDLLKIIKKYC